MNKEKIKSAIEKDQYACAFKRWAFADGTPFGIKEE